MTNEAQGVPETRVRETSPLLIVGAGPFGLAAAAAARARGIEHVICGHPMSFWKRHMPEGMLLRSPPRWHIDPAEVFTYVRFCTEYGLPCSEDLPIPVERYLDYADWFIEKTGVEVREVLVRRLEIDREGGGLLALFEDGSVLRAKNVLCAPGLRHFRHFPENLVETLGEDALVHSCDIRTYERYRGKRCLILGGRQSAFELGALLAERAAAKVTIVHRHPTPAFAESDWSWVAGQIEEAERTPGWFAALPSERQKEIHQAFWAEGRLKLEPWLADRVRRAGIRVIENTRVESVRPAARDRYDVLLRGEASSALDAAEISCATGFRVDLERVDYLNALASGIETVDGFPDLDRHFRCVSLPRVCMTGLSASRNFGPYLGFLASCPFAARRVVAGHLARP